MMNLKRSLNFEIMRIAAMLFIVIFHFFIHGVMHNHTTPALGFAVNEGSTMVEWFNYVLSEVIIVIVSTGVNLFVMISGYFLIARIDFRIKSLIKLWVRIFFYSLSITLLFFIFGKVEVSSVLLSFFPLSFPQYWFMNTYFGLMIIAPFLSILVRNINQSQYRILLAVMFAINFIVPFGRFLSGGRDLLWFIFLFLLAGYLKIYKTKKCKKQELITFLLVITVSAFYILYPFVVSCILNTEKGSFIKGYHLTEPINNGLIFFISLLFFVIFKDRNFSCSENTSILVKTIASSTVGVYLISDNRLVRNFLWEEFFNCQSLMVSIFAIPIMIVIAIAIFSVAIIIDMIVSKILDTVKFEERFIIAVQRSAKLVRSKYDS